MHCGTSTVFPGSDREREQRESSRILAAAAEATTKVQRLAAKIEHANRLYRERLEGKRMKKP